jgi:hypothetical protein
MAIVKLSELADNLIPEATYNVRVHDAEHVERPDKDPYIKVKLIIQGPDGPWTGRIIFVIYMLAGSGAWKLRKLLEVTGHSPDFERRWCNSIGVA